MSDPEVSEFYLNTMQHIIGVGFKRCEEVREKLQGNTVGHPEMIDACARWWNSLNAFGLMIGNLAKSEGELCHMTISVGNHKRLLADSIREYLGFCPIRDVDLNGKSKKDCVPRDWYTLKYVYAKH